MSYANGSTARDLGQTGEKGCTAATRGRSSAARSTSSTARRIAVSVYVRRFLSVLLFDAVLVIVLAGAFWYRCAMQVPGYESGLRLLAEGGVHLQVSEEGAGSSRPAPWEWELVVADGTGTWHAFPLSEPLS